MTLYTLRYSEQCSLWEDSSHLLRKQMLPRKSHPTETLLLKREIYDSSLTA